MITLLLTTINILAFWDDAKVLKIVMMNDLNATKLHSEKWLKW